MKTQLTKEEKAKYRAQDKLLDKCYAQLRKANEAMTDLYVLIFELTGPNRLPKNLKQFDKLTEDWLGQAQYLMDGPRNDDSVW